MHENKPHDGMYLHGAGDGVGDGVGDGAGDGAGIRRDAIHCVSTPNTTTPNITKPTTTQTNTGQPGTSSMGNPTESINKKHLKNIGPNNAFGPQQKNLASIVRGYKISVAKYGRIINRDFSWQAGFYDRIIRNMNAYYTIEKYIIANPSRWSIDKFNNNP